MTTLQQHPKQPKRVKRNPATISPRFKAPTASGHRINFTQRTLDRLYASWRFGLLDETHLHKLLSSYGRQTHRELELTKAGLIYHPEAQIPLRAVCSDISWITALSNKGADTLAAKGYRIDPTQHRERYRRHKSYNAILHDLNRSDFLVEMELACRMTGDGKGSSNAATTKISHQDELMDVPYTETISFPSIAVWKKEHRPLKIEPDGIFSLRLPNLPAGRAEKFFALEIDQDTESNVRYRNFWEQKSVLKTIIAYAEAHKRGIINDRLGFPNLRTLFVTTTDRHMENIIKDAKTHYLAHGYPANAILFVSRERLEKFDPLSVEYKNAAGNSVIITELY
jgi:hypothetical protein